MQEHINNVGSTSIGSTFFTKEQVYKATQKYFNNNEMLTNIWMSKYCLKDNLGQYKELTPDEMHKRLAKEFTRIEQKYEKPLTYDEIYEFFKDFKYIIPGGSILYGVGNNYSMSSLGNCFVIGNNSDSYGGICLTDQEQVQLMKRRAGVGHDLSHLRPANTNVSNAASTSSGAVSFMPRYSSTTREVAQDGRRGALMLTLDIHHPDIEEFITSKDDLSKITGANISVKIDDAFMKAVENDEYYNLHFSHKPSSKKGILSLVNARNEVIVIKAKKLWDKLIHQATKSAEPGILFWDKIKSESISSCYGKDWEETSTNPCGEIPLCPYDSCRLMSVNLYSFVENPFTDKAFFNYDKFKDVVYKAQRLMDDIVDLEEEKINLILNKIENDLEPEEIKTTEKNLWLKIKQKLLEGRRTGLSAIGLADCFASLHRTYGSQDSIELTEEIYKQFAISAYKSSIDMAKERGTFPIFDPDKETDNPFLIRLFPELSYLEANNGRRNIALLTIPPSGTISLLAGISSGIEPVYQLSYKRRRKLEKGNPNITFVDQNGDGWEEYNVFHPKYKLWCEMYDVNPNDLEEATKISPYDNSTAYEIDPLQRVNLQATIQKWIDHSISSTINLSETATEEEVSNIYMQAWKEGCKGITIYRDNCRTGVLISNTKKDIIEFKQHNAPKRPKELICDIKSVSIKGKKFQVLIGLYNNKPYEVFVIPYKEIKPLNKQYKITKLSSGKYILSTLNWQEKNNINSGYNFGLLTEELTDEEATITRLVSTSLRHGASIKFIIEQLDKTHGDLTQFGKAIARALKNYISDTEITKELCPDCKSKLIYKDGCITCLSCGYSKCG